jgi:hypothetical protein
VCKPGKGSSLETKLAHTLILDFPSPRTLKNKYLQFMIPSLWYFCYGSPNWISHEKKSNSKRFFTRKSDYHQDNIAVLLETLPGLAISSRKRPKSFAWPSCPMFTGPHPLTCLIGPYTLLYLTSKSSTIEICIYKHIFSLT